MSGLPVTAEEFAARMGRLGGFESRPRLAVAVSGGADSMALALLAQHWAGRVEGTVLALTVDHRLRLESTREATAVGRELAARGIEHAVLVWEDIKPTSGIQQAAREARYRLLINHCAARGVFHLLLAHHRDDQQETVLLRLKHGSGADGLAGMAAVREVPELRLLRPLLDLPKTRLMATCQAAGVVWHEDPSNHSPAYGRGRLRLAHPALKALGLDGGALAETARRLGQTRAGLEDITAAVLARSVVVYPAGFLRLELDELRAAPTDIGQRALVRCLAVVGGSHFPPRHARLDRLYLEITSGLCHGRTLGGCRILPRDRHLLVVREPAAQAGSIELGPEDRIWWDNRFMTWLERGQTSGPIMIGALGREGWRRVRDCASNSGVGRLSAEIGVTLPAFWDACGLLAVPHIDYRRSTDIQAKAIFMPKHLLAGPRFTVA